ncbi:DMT family transporter [Rhodoligotrophos defluvii]|uniref:DMT family transporter n=1 Tax=Rhodoligotrophos defluvii TaxID=2561934 RepID=UPI0010C95736|nr:DMT family transporter [Rhodoligotrophos defluvii]
MSSRLYGNLAGVFSMLVWSTGLPAAAEVLKTWHPLLVMPVRMALAGVVLSLVVLAWNSLPRLTLQLGKDIMLAGSAMGISGLFLVWGQAFAHPVNVAIIVASMPAISAAVGMLTGRERLTVTIALGVALAMAGGIVTIAGREHGGPERVALGLGELLVFISTVLFVLFTRISVDRLGNMSDLARAAVTTTASSLVTAPIAVIAGLLGLAELNYALDAKSVGLLVWLGCIGIGLSSVFWMAACRMLGVTVASMHNNMIPFYTMLFALLLGQAVSLVQALGGVLVICGAVLAQLQFRSLKFRPKGGQGV